MRWARRRANPAAQGALLQGALLHGALLIAPRLPHLPARFVPSGPCACLLPALACSDESPDRAPRLDSASYFPVPLPQSMLPDALSILCAYNSGFAPAPADTASPPGHSPPGHSPSAERRGDDAASLASSAAATVAVTVDDEPILAYSAADAFASCSRAASSRGGAASSSTSELASLASDAAGGGAAGAGGVRRRPATSPSRRSRFAEEWPPASGLRQRPKPDQPQAEPKVRAGWPFASAGRGFFR